MQSRFAAALRDREIGRAEVGAARVQLALIFAAVQERAPALVAELASQADLSEASALAMVNEWRHPRRNAASLLADGTGRADFAAALELREAGRQRIVTAVTTMGRIFAAAWTQDPRLVGCLAFSADVSSTDAVVLAGRPPHGGERSSFRAS